MTVYFRALLPPGDGPSPQLPRGASDEHYVVAGRVQRPVVSLPRVVVRARNLDETLVQRQVVSYRVLPALLVLSVVGKVLEDVVVDTAQGELSLGAGAYCHHYQCVVGEWRFLELLFLVVQFGVFVVVSILYGRLCISAGTRGQGFFQLGGGGRGGVAGTALFRRRNDEIRSAADLLLSCVPRSGARGSAELNVRASEAMKVVVAHLRIRLG